MSSSSQLRTWGWACEPVSQVVTKQVLIEGATRQYRSDEAE